MDVPNIGKNSTDQPILCGFNWSPSMVMLVNHHTSIQNTKYAAFASKSQQLQQICSAKERKKRKTDVENALNKKRLDKASR